MENIPNECFIEILVELSLKDLGLIVTTCKLWYEVIESLYFWRRIYDKLLGGEFILETKEVLKNFCIQKYKLFINLPDEEKLIKAAFEGYINIIKKIHDVNVNTNNKATPLWFASQNNHYNVVSYLINNDANMEIKSRGGATPLFIAALKNNYNIVELLLQKGANINNIHNRTKVTALYGAAEKNCIESIKILLKYGAYINQKGKDGASPLYIACQNGHLEAVKLLIENNAEIDSKFNTNATPLYIATKNGYSKVVSYLLEKGADINNVQIHGKTILYVAIKHQHLDVIDILLSYGAKINNSRKSFIKLLDRKEKVSKHFFDFTHPESLRNLHNDFLYHIYQFI